MRHALKDQAFSRYLGFDRNTQNEQFTWPHARYLGSIKEILHTRYKMKVILINTLMLNELYKSCRTSTVLHLYDDENIDRLNILLGNTNSLESLTPIGKQNGSSEAVWLVHVPFADESYLSNIFRRSL
jgi:hypothetical protein